MTAMRFAGQRALVTGAASGIGMAVAQALAAEGAQLVLVDRNATGVEVAQRRIGDCVVGANIGDVASEVLWDDMSGDLAGLDIAVVNAGVAGASPITELAFTEWRRILSTNLDGAFLALRAAMRAMTGRGGSIVLTASVSGIKAEPGVAAYGASKAGLIHLAKVAAKEGAANGIRVNAIAPGGVETPVWREVPFFNDLVAQKGSEEAAFRAMAEMATPLGRYARPGEIAEQVLFLLSPAAATITGTTLTTDGGYSL